MPGSARAHVSGKSENTVDHAAQIDRENEVIAFGRGIGEFLAVGGNAGIAAQDIDRAKGSFGFHFGFRPGLAIAHVEHLPAHAVAPAGSDLGQCIGIDVGNRHRHAARGQCVDHAQAKPGSPAGDKGVFRLRQIH